VSSCPARQRQKALLFPLFLTSALLSARTSRAEDPTSPPPADADRPPAARVVRPAHPDDLPPNETKAESETKPERDTRTGFEASLSLAYAAPGGSATGAPGDNMTASFAGQFPIGIQIGWAVTPAFFIGPYGSVAPGGVGSAASGTCQTYDLNCSSISFHGGLAVEYRFNTPESIQPWIGYGIGYESASVALSSSTQSASLNANGWEFGRFPRGSTSCRSPASVSGSIPRFPSGSTGTSTSRTRTDRRATSM